MTMTMQWETIVARSELGSGYKDTAKSHFLAASQGPFTHIRLNMFPDGGIARMRRVTANNVVFVS